MTICWINRGRYRSTIFGVWLVMIISVPALCQRPDLGPYRVTAVRAFLYLNQKDTLSANILDNPSLGELLNVGVGPDWLGSASDEVLITVEVAGPPGDYKNGARVHLTVSKPDGTVLLERRPTIGVFSDDGKWFAPFLVYGIGCDPLRIRAEITGQKESSVVEKRIPFVCGE